MIFGYFTLFVALAISAVAEFYSIVGLMAIFAAAPIPAAIMGATLGVGKITGAVWLKLNWHRAPWTYKAYLIPAVATLMFLTSMGIFGFLSKAHSDQSLVSGDVVAKISVYDEKIKIEKENIDANRKALKQLDEAVDQVMGRSTSETGADKAVAIRRSQQKERGRLQSEIAESQKRISVLSEERAPIAAEVRKVEAEVGPIKYIAAMVYGDNPDANLLEAAVRWVIILIVAVFDPLALVLILAAQQSLRWGKEEHEVNKFVEQAAKETLEDIDKNEQAVAEEYTSGEMTKDTQAEKSEGEPQQPAQDYPYLKQGFKYPPGWMFSPPVVAKPEITDDQAAMNIVAEPPGVVTRPFTAEEIAALDSVETATESEVSTQQPESKILAAGVDIVDRPGDYLTSEPEWTGPMKEVVEEFIDPNTRIKTLVHKMVPDLSAQPDGVPAKADFGTQFPAGPSKGDMYVRVDFLPPRLFKFNGARWMEVDKTMTDSHYSEEYIRHLIDKIASGEYSTEDLSENEQEQIREYLKTNGN